MHGQLWQTPTLSSPELATFAIASASTGDAWPTVTNDSPVCASSTSAIASESTGDAWLLVENAHTVLAHS
eukprot:11580608-Karenia_brevis.AAC.1